jgi:hypothetical protein
MRPPNRLLIIIFVTTATTGLYRIYSTRDETSFKPHETCIRPLNMRFGSFSCRNFRPDYTLDTSGTRPFISGANLVLFADHVYDQKSKMVASQVKNSHVIFVKTDFISDFFVRVYPQIGAKFILITHNSDYATNEEHKRFLLDDKLLAWFGQNPGFVHPKHFPLPLGLENPTWFTAKLDFVRSVVDTKRLLAWEKRKFLLYINFNSATNPKSRTRLVEKFKNIKEVFLSETRVDYANYMGQIENSKFVLCPRGNGEDTHRFYETLLMGSIPVVENSTLYSLFEESGALVVPDLNLLTIEMLKQSARSGFSDRNVLMWKTWEDRINSMRSIP